MPHIAARWRSFRCQSLCCKRATSQRQPETFPYIEHRFRREQLALPIGLLLKLAVLVLSVPFIMLQCPLGFAKAVDVAAASSGEHKIVISETWLCSDDFERECGQH
jgi:hypothetical protein